MNLKEITDVLREVNYKNWTWSLTSYAEGFLFQLKFIAADAGTLTRYSEQSGRKWYISSHATKSEIIQTAFKAVLTAEEHEVREAFTYRGVPVMHPHYDVEDLRILNATTDRDVRA